MKILILLIILIFSVKSYSQDTTIVYEYAGVGFNDVSSNGEWVSGTDGANAYLWSEATGLILLGQGIAKGVSNTGRVVGEGVDSTLLLPNGTPVPVACYWDPDGTKYSLGRFLDVLPFDPTLYSHGNSISDDGTIIAGMGCYPDYTTEAFTWTADSGYVLYGKLGYNGTRANVISGDGNVIAGWGLDSNYQRLPVIWNPDPYIIPPFGPYQGGEIEGLNNDGSIAYGETFGPYAYVPFYWTEATGAVNLTDINIQNPAYAFDGNSDASRIVGRIGPYPGQAYIWEHGNGQYLKDWVLAHGGQISNDFIVTMANGISSDGNTICGWGALPGTFVSGVIIKIQSIVPVEFTSFTATKVENSVQLNWSTASETNNSGFEVQRKTGNSEWLNSGFVPGSGNSTEIHNYSYRDNSVTPGNYTYRLKQIDYDGSYAYSDEVNIIVSAPVKFNLAQNYPNPFNPTTTIEFSIPEQSFVNLSVFNMLGEKVATLVNEMIEGGNHRIEFNASQLASGVYLLKLSSGNFSDVKKINLLK